MNALCPQCGAPVQEGATKCEYCGASVAQNAQPQQQAQPQPQVVYVNNERANWPIKNKIVAILLAFFLGSFGIHKFYLGQKGKGIVYLIFFWTYVPGILAFIEAIVMLLSNDEDFQIKYKCRLS